MATPETFIETVKNVATVSGILVGISTLLIHWKPIFRPKANKLEDRTFASVEELYHFLIDIKFYWVYSNGGSVSLKEMKELFEDRGGALTSPFLPPKIYEATTQFIMKLNGSVVFRLLAFGEKKPESLQITKNELESILQSHENAYSKVVKWLGCTDKKFPFIIAKENPAK